MKLKQFLLIIAPVFILYSCEIMYPCLEGNGVLTTEERAVTHFTSVNASAGFDVELIYSTDSYISVEADENLQKYIRTYVHNGELVLETEQGRCLRSGNRILVTVYCPFIEAVVLSGSGDMEVSGFSADNFDIILSGSGDIDIAMLTVSERLTAKLTGSGDIMADGSANEANFTLSGSGSIHADRFRVNNCYIVLSGSGNSYVYATSYLKVRLSGSGDVLYYGGPERVDKRITGSGKIIQK
ncbi:MAG: DUF2807 domain-containing protein [Bacteroidales bacterium]|nr:DUF2807 domain-containing protein [Bacteroidales bacterium]